MSMTREKAIKALFMKGGKDRQKNRAKAFPGLARAMAQQWGGICDG